MLSRAIATGLVRVASRSPAFARPARVLAVAPLPLQATRRFYYKERRTDHVGQQDRGGYRGVFSMHWGGPTRVYVLNKELTGHALTSNMVQYLISCVSIADSSQEVKSITIRSAGTNTFCLGLDVKGRMRKYEGEQAIKRVVDLQREAYKLAWVIHRTVTPTVPHLDGSVAGAGLGLGIHGKYRACSENTSIRFDGFVPEGGSSHVLARLDHNLGMFLALTGTPVLGTEAVMTGICNLLIESAAFSVMEGDLEDNLGHWSTADTLINAHNSMDYTGWEKSWSLYPYLQTIDRIFGLDSVEKITAALKAETKHADFAQQALEGMQNRSPTSLKLTHRLIRMGAKDTLDGCMRNEFRAYVRALTGPSDLRDKLTVSKALKFNPPTLEGVTEELLNEYLLPGAKIIALAEEAKKPLPEGVGVAWLIQSTKDSTKPEGELQLPGVEYDLDFEHHSKFVFEDQDRLKMAIPDPGDTNEYPVFIRELGVDEGARS